LVIEKGKRERAKNECWQILKIPASVRTIAPAENDIKGTSFQKGFFCGTSISV